jgi:hypothetical protein
MARECLSRNEFISDNVMPKSLAGKTSIGYKRSDFECRKEKSRENETFAVERFMFLFF